MKDYEETIDKAKEAWDIWADVSMAFMLPTAERVTECT